MVESKILNTRYQGNWVEENQLTEGVQNNKRFEIFSNAIKRYADELAILSSGKTKDLKDHNSYRPTLDLPEFEEKFDLINAKRYSKRIQSWQGIVTSIGINTFHAKLYDLTLGGTNEIAEFDLEDISPDDLDMLKDGATFYWSVGHYMENGQSVKRSDIRFQRLITLDADDIEMTKSNLEIKYSNLKERIIDNINS